MAEHNLRLELPVTSRIPWVGLFSTCIEFGYQANFWLNWSRWAMLLRSWWVKVNIWLCELFRLSSTDLKYRVAIGEFCFSLPYILHSHSIYQSHNKVVLHSSTTVLYDTKLPYYSVYTTDRSIEVHVPSNQEPRTKWRWFPSCPLVVCQHNAQCWWCIL